MCIGIEVDLMLFVIEVLDVYDVGVFVTVL